jgi:hypothetical protein
MKVVTPQFHIQNHFYFTCNTSNAAGTVLYAVVFVLGESNNGYEE